MAGKSALIILAAQSKVRNKRSIGSMDLQGREGGHGGRGRGHCTMMLNGVDVLDPLRNFTSNEWCRLIESS